MIKKVINIILSFTIILAIAGVTVTKHYCGNNLISTSIITHPKSCCGDDCKSCHNETITVKITDNFSNSLYNFNAYNDYSIIDFYVLNQLHQEYFIPTQYFFDSKAAPPNHSRIALLEVYRC